MRHKASFTEVPRDYVGYDVINGIIVLFNSYFLIANFDIKIQPNTIDLSTRLRGTNGHKLCIYSPESRAEIYCFRLNFKGQCHGLRMCKIAFSESA